MPLSSVTALLTRISVEHIPALTVLAFFCVGKLAARGAFGGPGWVPICLCHNVLSVALGGYSLWHWGDADLSDACAGLSDARALVILLQVRAERAPSARAATERRRTAVRGPSPRCLVDRPRRRLAAPLAARRRRRTA